MKLTAAGLSGIFTRFPFQAFPEAPVCSPLHGKGKLILKGEKIGQEKVELFY
jgi:hypothetical protein